MKKKIILIAISFTITLGLILSLTNKKYYGDIKVKFNDNDYVLEYVKKNNSLINNYRCVPAVIFFACFYLMTAEQL